MVRAAAGRASGATTKTSSKKAIRADKAFMDAMQTTYLSEQEEKTQYVHDMVDSNPSWVPWLETLFKTGRMERFVKKQGASGLDEDEDDIELGRKVSSRVTKLAKLPKRDLFELLTALRPNFPAEDASDELGRALFKYIMHIDDNTPWPLEPKSRHMNVLIQLCRMRDNDCGRRLSTFDMSTLISAGVNSLAFFEVIGTNLKYKPTGELSGLPVAPDGTETFVWFLEKPLSYDSLLICPQAPAIRLTPGLMFPEAMSMATAWTYIVETAADSQSCGSAPSTSAGSGAASSSQPSPNPRRRLALQLSPPVVAPKRKVCKSKPGNTT